MAAPRPFTWNRPDDLATAKNIRRALARRIPSSVKLCTPVRDFIVTRDAADPTKFYWMASDDRKDAERAATIDAQVRVEIKGREWWLMDLVIHHMFQRGWLRDPGDYNKLAPKRVQDTFDRLLTDAWADADPDGLIVATMTAGDAVQEVIDSYAAAPSLLETRLAARRPVAYRALAKLTAMTMPPGDARDVAMQLAETWTGDGKELLVVAKQVAASS